MLWVDPQSTSVRRDGKIALLTKLAQLGRATPQQHFELGNLQLAAADFVRAEQSFRVALAEWDDPAVWEALASALLELNRPAEAIAACDNIAETAGALLIRGRALNRLGRGEEARAALLRSLSDPDFDFFPALDELLILLAKSTDGTALLDTINAQPSHRAATALARAFKGIALERLGRHDEACAIMNLEACIKRVAFVPPAPFASIEAFNVALAEAVAADPATVTVVLADSEINLAPRGEGPAFAALYAFMRQEMVAYIDDLEAYRMAEILGPAPAKATFYTANTVLWGDGHNGQHIHNRGYISAVYHAVVPPEISDASDDRGMLTLGGCNDYAPGLKPSWGRRLIKPEAGVLTIFPSHIFHDVVPTGLTARRISIVADLRPIWDQDSRLRR
ncbi:putative 2OG-Fe(II) oxygenase [Sphingomonas sp.]|uniref:putative 2OG-Fe(II) oxygenase n=1 Tax=Sphingomonas sp. TaxID=28214 RepID=UPI0035A969DA